MPTLHQIDVDAVLRQLSRIHLRSIVESTARLNVWTGSVRSGKTVSSLLRFLIAIAQAPATGRILVFGKTRETVSRNVFGVLQDPTLFGDLTRLVEYTAGAPTARILGRQVDVMGAADAKAEAKVRGMTLCLAYGDELTTLPKDFFKQVLARLSVRGARLFGTTNPDSPVHWFKKEFINRGDKGEIDLRHWHSTLDDNPHLDQDYVSNLKREYTGLWYKRFILGKWVLAEGAIYECWDEDRHVLRGPIPTLGRRLAVGIDYGTTNPFVALMFGTLPDGRLCFSREFRWDSKVQQRSLTDVEYSAKLRAWMGDEHPEWVCVDPSAASFSKQLFADGVTPANADNSVLDGIRTTASLLAQDLLVVHESCEGWLEEAPGYVWDPEKSEESGVDEPVKQDDHDMDAGRYAVATTEVNWRPLIRSALALAA